MKKHIPNFITSLNLVCGCLAIVAAFENRLDDSAILIAIAAVLDFLDGFAARLLNVHSEIGKQLDSLADMVTFGVAPGMILYTMLEPGYNVVVDGHTLNFERYEFIKYLALLIPVFSAVRLAKFNIDTRQSDSFIGVPTPANCMFIASIPVILMHQNGYTTNPDGSFSLYNFIEIIGNQWFLGTLILVMSYLMVAELPLFALKFKSFDWQNNKLRYIFLSLSAILIVSTQFISIPIIIVLYILLSIATGVFKTGTSTK